MAGKVDKADATAIGNLFVDFGLFTECCCHRCLAFWGSGELRFLGFTGCCVPDQTRATPGLFDAWSAPDNEGGRMKFIRCFRCFVTNSECCAVPEGLVDQLPPIVRLLKELRNNAHWVWGPDPDWVAPDQASGPILEDEAEVDFDADIGSPPASPRAPDGAGPANGKGAAVAPRIRLRVNLSKLEYDRKAMELSKLARVLSKRIEKGYSPYRDRLFLHSGVVEAGDDAESEVHPNGRRRDRNTVASGVEASKRTYEIMSASKVAVGPDGEHSPFKKPRGGRVEVNVRKQLHDKRQSLAGQIVTLEVERTGKSGPDKGKVTKAIKILEKEREALADRLKALGDNF